MQLFQLKKECPGLDPGKHARSSRKIEHRNFDALHFSVTAEGEVDPGAAQRLVKGVSVIRRKGILL